MTQGQITLARTPTGTKLRGWEETAFALIGAAVLAGILLGTLSPQQEVPSDLPGTDKLHHILGFAALVVPMTVLRPQRALWAVPAAILLGVAIEFVQPLVEREFSVGDMIANALGAGMGALLGAALHRPVRRLLLRNPTGAKQGSEEFSEKSEG